MASVSGSDGGSHFDIDFNELSPTKISSGRDFDASIGNSDSMNLFGVNMRGLDGSLKPAETSTQRLQFFPNGTLQKERQAGDGNEFSSAHFNIRQNTLEMETSKAEQDPLLNVTATISRDSTAGLREEQDRKLAAHFERRDPSMLHRVETKESFDGQRLQDQQIQQEQTQLQQIQEEQMQQKQMQQHQVQQKTFERQKHIRSQLANQYVRVPRLPSGFSDEQEGNAMQQGRRDGHARPTLSQRLQPANVRLSEPTGSDAVHDLDSSHPRLEAWPSKTGAPSFTPEKHPCQVPGIRPRWPALGPPKGLLIRHQSPEVRDVQSEATGIDEDALTDQTMATGVNGGTTDDTLSHAPVPLPGTRNSSVSPKDAPPRSLIQERAPEGLAIQQDKRKRYEEAYGCDDEDSRRPSSRPRTISYSMYADAARDIAQNSLETERSSIQVSSHARNPDSRYIRSLLRTIRAQENDIRYLQNELDGDSQDSEEDSVQVPTPPFQDLYAVTCEKSQDHTMLFQDSPVSRISTLERRYGHVESRIFASGESPICASLREYLANRNSLHFVALWITECPEFNHKRGADPKDLKAKQLRLKFQKKLYLLAISRSAKDLMEELGKYDLPRASDVMRQKVGQLDIPGSLGVIDEDGFYFHHIQDLRLAFDNPRDRVQSDCLSALKAALKSAAPVWDEQCEEERHLFSRGLVTRSSLSRLFHPNMAILAHPEEAKNEPVVGIISSIQPGSLQEIQLHYWTWEFDGSHFQRENFSTLVEIPEDLADDQPTQSNRLTACPLDYTPLSTVKTLTERAQKFWGLREQRFVSYTGLDANSDYHYQSARFIVDVVTHRRFHKKTVPLFQQKQSRVVDRFPFEIGVDDPMPEGIVLLAMPATIPGYSLKEKKWISLHVKSIQEVHFNKHAFDSLMLDPQTKELAKALVMTQDIAEGPNDVIEGKGNGLILLLHGGPGTGKTLTAESVAKIAEKPLYRVTCGDIGTDPEKVEDYLNTVLYLGKLWGCVVLLDEADVFLEERDFNDLTRNSLVSVFLRSLEYYEGILILTSNRVGTIDEAFKSRIHVAIHYPDLSRATRKKIWRNFLDILEENDDCDANVAEINEHMDELVDLELNGRQIRDAVSTARRLALYKHQRMAWVHVFQVVQVVDGFSAYLERTRKHKDPQRAREMGLRAPA